MTLSWEPPLGCPISQANFLNIFKKLKAKKTRPPKNSRQFFTPKLNASEIFEASAKKHDASEFFEASAKKLALSGFYEQNRLM